MRMELYNKAAKSFDKTQRERSDGKCSQRIRKRGARARGGNNGRERTLSLYPKKAPHFVRHSGQSEFSLDARLV